MEVIKRTSKAQKKEAERTAVKSRTGVQAKILPGSIAQVITRPSSTIGQTVATNTTISISRTMSMPM